MKAKAPLKRSQIFDLAQALGLCARLELNSKFRYAIERNRPWLEAEMAATRAALPRPDTAPLEQARAAAAASRDQAVEAARKEIAMEARVESERRAEADYQAELAKIAKDFSPLLDEWASWEKQLAAHLAEEDEWELYQISASQLPELDDLITYPPNAALDPATGRVVWPSQLTFPPEVATPDGQLEYREQALQGLRVARARHNQELIKALLPMIRDD